RLPFYDRFRQKTVGTRSPAIGSIWKLGPDPRLFYSWRSKPDRYRTWNDAHRRREIRPVRISRSSDFFCRLCLCGFRPRYAGAMAYRIHQSSTGGLCPDTGLLRRVPPFQSTPDVFFPRVQVIRLHSSLASVIKTAYIFLVAIFVMPRSAQLFICAI